MTIQERYENLKQLGLNLNMKRGQPADDQFDLSNPLFTIVDGEDTLTPSGIEIRNYPGGVAGLPEARELFSQQIGVAPSEIIVGNNSSLEMMANILQWAMIKGMKDSAEPWLNQSPKLIVTIPGYDRHFKLAAALGFELIPVDMTPTGPDIVAIEKLVAEDASIKGIYFVPTYSNPTGDSISDENVQRLASMSTAANDFTILADDAYRVHHFSEEQDNPANLLEACKAAGNPDRVIIFGSTSKITFASAGIGFMGMSEANLAHWTSLLGLQTIGPNKIEQYRHIKFIGAYPGGLEGLMADHAKSLGPKFAAVQRVLGEALDGKDLATWTNPRGGYFVSLDCKRPVASRVVELAAEAGIALTNAGATYIGGVDPYNRNIRIAPSRPPLAEVEEAMAGLAVCIEMASAEFDAAQ